MISSQVTALRAARDEALGEEGAGVAMVERAVDMRRLDRDQPGGADQPRALRYEKDPSGRAVIDILGDLRGNLAGQIGADAGDQGGRDDTPSLQDF